MNTMIRCALGLAIAVALSAAAHAADATYTADLKPLNTRATGTETTGDARLEVEGNTLTIDIRIEGAPPGMVHWQHFHGFEDGRTARCASVADDANGDGLVDLKETEAVSGTTMVPFTQNPADMDVADGTYPRADADGKYHYTATVSMQALEAAVEKAFPRQKPDLGKRVIYIHGVPESTALPDSVASLDPVPAHTTLPIACGMIQPGGNINPPLVTR